MEIIEKGEKRKMSKMRNEGSIPSGRAAPLTQENQVLSHPATEQVSGVWSGVGPECPDVGDRIQVRQTVPGQWINGTVEYLSADRPGEGDVRIDACETRSALLLRVPFSRRDLWRWPTGKPVRAPAVTGVDKGKRVPVPFRDRVEVYVGPCSGWRLRLVLGFDKDRCAVQVPDESGSCLRPLWYQRGEWREPAAPKVPICPGCGESVVTLDAEWGLCDRCVRERKERSELAGDDPRVAHGKNGVPPLPAVPDAEPEPRRCVGAPGCTCEAVLGPVSECPSDRCAHCENLTREIERQTADTEEGIVDCDACNPDRVPRTGELCGRCQAQQKRFLDDAGELLSAAGYESAHRLSDLVALRYMTPEESQGVRSALGKVLTVLAAELKVMSARQEVTMVALVREAVNSLIGLRNNDGRTVARAVRS